MTTEERFIKNKVGMLELAKQLGNVSQACTIFGYSRENLPAIFADIKEDTVEENSFLIPPPHTGK